MTDPKTAAFAIAFLMAGELAAELLEDQTTPVVARDALESLRCKAIELSGIYSAAASRDVHSAQSRAELHCGMMNVHVAAIPLLKARLDAMVVSAERMYMGER